MFGTYVVECDTQDFYMHSRKNRLVQSLAEMVGKAI